MLSLARSNGRVKVYTEFPTLNETDFQTTTYFHKLVTYTIMEKDLVFYE